MRLRYIDAKLKGKIMQRVFPLDACQRRPMLCPHSVSFGCSLKFSTFSNEVFERGHFKA